MNIREFLLAGAIACHERLIDELSRIVWPGLCDEDRVIVGGLMVAFESVIRNLGAMKRPETVAAYLTEYTRVITVMGCHADLTGEERAGYLLGESAILTKSVAEAWGLGRDSMGVYSAPLAVPGLGLVPVSFPLDPIAFVVKVQGSLDPIAFVVTVQGSSATGPAPFVIPNPPRRPPDPRLN